MRGEDMQTKNGHCRQLGATIESGGVNFSLWARLASAVELLLFSSPDDVAPTIIKLNPKVNRTAYYWHIWVEGIGEKIQAIALPPSKFAVLKPHAGVETAQIFRHSALQRNSETATMPVFAVDPYGFGRNDLQPVAQALCPEITEALEWLGSYGLSPRMTGSGSAVFAQLLSGVLIESAPHHWQMRICSNMAVHPQAGWAASES